MISNASPIITLAKSELIEKCLKIYNIIEVSPEVYQETIKKGKEIKKYDALILGALEKEGKIKVINLDKQHLKLAEKLELDYNLDKGEAETIALALQLRKKELLMDESLGRRVAKILGITPKGTLRVLLELYKKNIIDEGTLKEKANFIIGNKFRLDAEIISKFWDLFEKMKEK